MSNPNKYNRVIEGTYRELTRIEVEVDVYDVLVAFKTNNPAIDHAIKKLLCAGMRGHKDLVTDLDEAIQSIQRAKELIHV